MHKRDAAAGKTQQGGAKINFRAPVEFCISMKVGTEEEAEAAELADV